jgi:hypothetical protein
MAELPSDPHILKIGHAPTPFTADEIREGCPAGRTIGLLIEPGDGDPYLRLNRFVAVDEEGADVTVESMAMDGEPLDDPVEMRSKWIEFQEHASFPEAQTAIDSEVLETRMGALTCKRYTVTDGPTSDVYWFAVDKPGMPVKVETLAQDGVPYYRMTMINDHR